MLADPPRVDEAETAQDLQVAGGIGKGQVGTRGELLDATLPLPQLLEGAPVDARGRAPLRSRRERRIRSVLDLYLTYSLIGALAERLNERLPLRSRHPLEGETRFFLDREPLAAPFRHSATQHGDVAETRLLERDRRPCRARLRSAAEHHLLLLELIEVADAPRKLGDRDVFGPPRDDRVRR